MKHLFFKILLLGFLVTVGLLGSDWLYRSFSNQSYRLPQNILPSGSLDEPYQIVKVGNSHAQSGITFRGYKQKSLDLSGVAQRFAFDLAYLKQHRQQIDTNALVLITVSPISFSHRPADRNDGLQGNYYGRISPFLIPDLKLSDYLQTQIFPFVRSGYLLRQRHADQVRDRISEEQRAPEQPSVSNASSKPRKQFGVGSEEDLLNVEAIKLEIAKPTSIDLKNHRENVNFVYHKWYETDEFGQQYFAKNSHDLEELIAYCYANGWRPVLITIPVTNLLLDGLLDDYMQTYVYNNLENTDLQGTKYLDFSKNEVISKDNYLFSNADHLNEKGAAIFSYVLLQELIDQEYLSPEDDGYSYEPF